MTIQAPLLLRLINHLGKPQSKDKVREVAKIQTLEQTEKVHKEKQRLAIYCQMAHNNNRLFNHNRRSNK